jgi:hypothetical protein
MKKLYFGLVFAVATLASAIGSALPACAVNFVYGNVTYDVTTHTGLSFNDLRAIITSPDNALWGANQNGYGNAGLAKALAGVVKGDLGYPNEINARDADYNSIDIKVGPYFAYGIHFLMFYPTTILSSSYASTSTYYNGQYGQLLDYVGINYCGMGSNCSIINQMPTDETYATATVVSDAVPEPLTILGSITATGFMAAFNRIKNKKKQNKSN